MLYSACSLDHKCAKILFILSAYILLAADRNQPNYAEESGDRPEIPGRPCLGSASRMMDIRLSACILADASVYTEIHHNFTMAIVHIVHFAYNCDEATKQEIASRFLKMQSQCVSKTDSKPYILSLTGGKNNSPEGMNDGLEVRRGSRCLLVYLFPPCNNCRAAPSRSPTVC